MPTAQANGIEVYYETHGEGEPLLLMMGYGLAHTWWPENFVGQLVEQGFKVILMDNRDIGKTERMERMGKPPIKKVQLKGLMGLPTKDERFYKIRDMAKDSVGLLDALGIESAHVGGLSMGGMISQRMAIDHPDRVRSLTLMCTNTGSPLDGLPTREMLNLLSQPMSRSRDEYVKRQLGTWKVLHGDTFHFDRDFWETKSAQGWDHGIDAGGLMRQIYAIYTSGNRRDELKKLHVPALVIHGTSDPLLRPAGARALNQLVRGSRMMMVNGMGHSLPDRMQGSFARAMADVAEL